MLMQLDILNALIQAGVGVLVLLIVLISILMAPRILEGIRLIVDQIRQTTEAGIDRVEGANTVLTEAIKMLQEVNRASIESRARLERRYDEVAQELAEVKQDFEQKLAAKDAEIAALRKQIAMLEDSAKEKDERLEKMGKELERFEEESKRNAKERAELDIKLTTALKERDDLQGRVAAIEAMQASQPDIKPVDSKPDVEKAA